MQVVPYGLLSLIAVFGFCFAWVVNQIYKRTVHPILSAIGGWHLAFSVLGVGVDLGQPLGFLLKVDNDLTTFFSSMVATTEHAIQTLFTQVVRAFGDLSRELGSLAQAVERKFLNFAVTTVPRALMAALRAAGLAFLFAFHSATGLVNSGLHALRLAWLFGIGSVERLVLLGLRTLRLAWLFGLHSLEQFGIRLLHRIELGWLLIWNSRDRFLAWLAAHLPGLIHWGGKTFRRGLVDALRFFGLSWLFSTPVARWAEWLLRQEIHAVVEFVTDALDFVFPNDICTLAAYNYDVAVYVFEPVLQVELGQTKWICHHSGHTLPSGTEDTPPYMEAWTASATPPKFNPLVPVRLAPGIALPRGVVKA